LIAKTPTPPRSAKSLFSGQKFCYLLAALKNLKLRFRVNLRIHGVIFLQLAKSLGFILAQTIPTTWNGRYIRKVIQFHANTSQLTSRT